MQMDYKKISEQLKSQMIQMVLHNLLYKNVDGQTQAAMLDELGLDWGDQEKAKISTQQYYMCAVCSYLKNEKRILSREQKANGDGGKWFIAMESREEARRYLEELETTRVEQIVEKSIDYDFCLMQKIFFGAPGTGKSHKIDAPENEGGLGLNAIPESRKFRTTFHPDYDYAQFVGAYKPKKVGDNITYSFSPQVFAKAYVAAYKNPSQPVYLVIEEINRGNCAQIFGDIFQLLDRDDEGFSRYEIDADADFAEWLESQIPDQVRNDVRYPGKGKLRLPPNFNILATMNTSDQSLFPMDSAFKRRFDWEYVPIKYEKDDDCGESWNADQFVIDLGLGDNNPRWLDFLEKVNDNVYDVTKSEDKQMGEFFVKPDVEKEVDGKKEKIVISLDMFKSKVLFYLWDSVYKDEVDDENAQKIFHFDYPAENGSAVTFQRLFKKKDDSLEIIKQMFKNLGVKIKDDKEP